MEDINRRNFLKMIGVGSGAIAASGIVPGVILAGLAGKDPFAFRAVGGLPGGAFPSYATYVLEGHVNPLTLSGVVTRTVYAGPPEATSQVALPGMTRVLRIDAGRLLGNVLHLRGSVDDRSQLRLGESSRMDFRIDRLAGIIHAPFFGTTVPLRLVTA